MNYTELAQCKIFTLFAGNKGEHYYTGKMRIRSLGVLGIAP
jgi:hypothetical protein